MLFENSFFFPFFTFSDPYRVEEILFLGQIFEMEILTHLHVLRSPESKNIFSGWSVCVRFIIRIYLYLYNSKKITSEASNLVFYICVIRRCYMKTFHKDRTKISVYRSTQKNSNTLRSMDGISC